MTALTFDEVKQLTQQVLQDNYIEEPPIDVRELAKNYGLNVQEKSFTPEFAHVSGFITIDNGSPRLVINTDDSPNRKNFTIAHELGHWLMHKDKLLADPKIGVLFRIPLGKLNADPLEQQANSFAANLLVPEKMLAQKQALTKNKKQLAELFGVSEEVIGYRLEHVNGSTRATATKS